ncbi:MAG: hypothetical protein WCQ41_06740 [Bacillota bacterium]
MDSQLKNQDDYYMSLTHEEMAITEKQIAILKTEQQKMPDGNLVRKLMNGVVRYYHSVKYGDGKERSQKYLSQKDKELIDKLRRKQFVKESLKCLESKIEVFKHVMSKYKPYFPSDIIENTKLEDDLPTTALLSKNRALNDWSKQKYEKCSFHSDGLLHFAQNGLKVRSKSEVIIANALVANNIPFRYEEKLTVGGRIFYPDFTILRPKDCKIIYWEHFGLINDIDYQIRNEHKLGEFKRIGLLPWRNYIATFDDESGSIDAQTINGIIRALILF